jgi:hypothetical protein
MQKRKSNGTIELLDSIGNFLTISASLCGAVAGVYLSYKKFEADMAKSYDKGKNVKKINN